MRMGSERCVFYYLFLNHVSILFFFRGIAYRKKPFRWSISNRLCPLKICRISHMKTEYHPSLTNWKSSFFNHIQSPKRKRNINRTCSSYFFDRFIRRLNSCFWLFQNVGIKQSPTSSSYYFTCVSSHPTTKKDRTPLLPLLVILLFNSPVSLYVQATWILKTLLHLLWYPLPNFYTPHPFLLYHSIRPRFICSHRLGME